ncbi:G-protein coupled receptor 12 [Frankliniella fusca]|uniref:G-protein coupled receptor 12 n=1 Tax=Frankliniella fusca TaxID=407009 RepID=A0AAE1HCC2_9NEOP|nr:G-protein coupled receptor 12 [Frankliniella fusca]
MPQNLYWKRAGAGASVRGSSHWASWDPLAVALQHKDLQQNHKCLQCLGCERCHLGQQRRSEGDVDFTFHSPGSWATLALNHPSLHKRIQNASWETCVLVLKSDSQWIPRCPVRRPPHRGAGTSPAEEEAKL